MRRPLLLLVLIACPRHFRRFRATEKRRRGARQEPDREGPVDRRQRVHARCREERSPRRHAHLAGIPDYNAVALARFFAVMKALEPQYKQDDDVAYTWGTKGKVTKCSIYLESWEADAKTGARGPSWDAKRTASAASP